MSRIYSQKSPHQQATPERRQMAGAVREHMRQSGPIHRRCLGSSSRGVSSDWTGSLRHGINESSISSTCIDMTVCAMERMQYTRAYIWMFSLSRGECQVGRVVASDVDKNMAVGFVGSWNAKYARRGRLRGGHAWSEGKERLKERVRGRAPTQDIVWYRIVPYLL